MNEHAGEKDAGLCRVETLSDGTQVRVNGRIERKELEAIARQVRERFDSECHDLSPYPMPAVAQRIHERETYWCDQPKGHEGPHRWATSHEWTRVFPPTSDAE